ncbi:dynein axonemal light chain 4-like [Artemia franciscana]|uniref:Dynein light chain n=1 Tax=Artemia franciscana TaxID=6661 RepID=A0AA88HSN1_ARTSF|nr:hypothetical protein QYM36_007351 [Artemia franciscana]KAK2717205.1 hypothetical protein QYM36_007351 [Artemia franciscana]
MALEAQRKIIHSYPLVRHCELPEDLKNDAVELCVSACDKNSGDNEGAARLIKETLDKKFGAAWHVVVGESFGFEVSHEQNNLLYMFYSGSLAVCAWRCS